MTVRVVDRVARDRVGRHRAAVVVVVVGPRRRAPTGSRRRGRGRRRRGRRRCGRAWACRRSPAVISPSGLPWRSTASKTVCGLRGSWRSRRSSRSAAPRRFDRAGGAAGVLVLERRVDRERVAGDAGRVAVGAGHHRRVVRVGLGDHHRARLAVVGRDAPALPAEQRGDERRPAGVDAVAVEPVDARST